MSTGTVFRVFRHADPVDPDVTPVEQLSFRHLDDDPACTGAQLSATERAA